MQSMSYPSPDACPLAKGGACKPYERLNVVIGDEDLPGSFVFRTTGFNSIRTLATRLHYFQAISGNRLACLPLELRLGGKSTRQSYGTPIFCTDLTVRGGMDMAEALLTASELDSRLQAAGFDQAALDKEARRGFAFPSVLIFASMFVGCLAILLLVVLMVQFPPPLVADVLAPQSAAAALLKGKCSVEPHQMALSEQAPSCSFFC